MVIDKHLIMDILTIWLNHFSNSESLFENNRMEQFGGKGSSK